MGGRQGRGLSDPAAALTVPRCPLPWGQSHLLALPRAEAVAKAIAPALDELLMSRLVSPHRYRYGGARRVAADVRTLFQLFRRYAHRPENLFRRCGVRGLAARTIQTGRGLDAWLMDVTKARLAVAVAATHCAAPRKRRRC